MKSDEYECITSEIVASIYKRVEGVTPDNVRYGKANLWRGASGYAHQIDVSVQGPTDVIFVECKHWNRNVSVDTVLTFFGRIEDIRTTLNKRSWAVMVTTRGWQSGASIAAEHFNIDLRFVQSASEFGLTYKTLTLLSVAPVSARLITPKADVRLTPQ